GIFCGRESEILEARRALGEQARRGCAFLLLSGASGSGKSSLVRAGLIPATVENELDETVSAWRTLVITPSELGADPVEGLARRLGSPGALPELRTAMTAWSDLVNGLKRDPALTVQLAIR